MPQTDRLRAVAEYIERMDGAELPADIAAETYAPTQVEQAPVRWNKPEEREDNALNRSEPVAIDTVLNGNGPQALNLDIGSSRDGSITGIEGVALSMHADTALALRAERISLDEDPNLYEIGREVLGLDDKQARALFQGPNTAGSARRWIGNQAAADACRALADGTAPEKLWEGKFDRLAIATAAARGSRRRPDGRAGEIELGVPPDRAGSNGAPDRLDRRRRSDRQRRLHRGERAARIRRPRRPGSDDRSRNSGPERVHRRRTLAHPAELRDRRDNVEDGVRIEAGVRIGQKRETEHEGKRSGTPTTICGGAVVGKNVTIDKPGTVVPPGWTVTERNIGALPARDTETIGTRDNRRNRPGHVGEAGTPNVATKRVARSGNRTKRDRASGSADRPRSENREEQRNRARSAHRTGRINRKSYVDRPGSEGRHRRLGRRRRRRTSRGDNRARLPGEEKNHDRRRRRGASRNRLRKTGRDPPAGRSDLPFPATGPPRTRRSHGWSRRESTRAPACTRRRRSPPAQR